MTRRPIWRSFRRGSGPWRQSPISPWSWDGASLPAAAEAEPAALPDADAAAEVDALPPQAARLSVRAPARNALAIRLSFISFSSHRGRSPSRFPIDLLFYHAKVVNCGYRIARLPPFCKRQTHFFAQCTALPRPQARFLWESVHEKVVQKRPRAFLNHKL